MPSIYQLTLGEIRHNVSLLKSKYHKGTLIDRGANGGVAGEDVRVVSKSDRTVNNQWN